MALWKIFLIVVLAILTAALILKFWRNILNVFILVGAAFISIILIVLLLPIDIVLKCCGYYSEERLQRKIVEQYDAIFFSVTSRKDLQRKIKAITKFEKTFYLIKEKKREKEIKKMLNECKWTLWLQKKPFFIIKERFFVYCNFKM